MQHIQSEGVFEPARNVIRCLAIINNADAAYFPSTLEDPLDFG